MKFLSSALLTIITTVSAETSEWGQTRNNLRGVGRLRRDLRSEASALAARINLSMSLPQEELPLFSMSLPEVDVELEQFEMYDSSISMPMSVPAAMKEVEFEEFDVSGESLSMSVAVTIAESDFEQFGTDFGSLSMSIPEEEFDLFEDVAYSVSMSMPAMTESEFEQFDVDFGSLSMSIPDEEKFEQFDDVDSLSMSMAVIEEDMAWFEQLSAKLGSLSMSIPEENFEQIEELEIVASISMSMPEEPPLEQFNNGFGVSAPKESVSTNDDFFFMPIFDDRTDVAGVDLDNEESKVPSMSMIGGGVEEEFDFFEVDQFSVSMSMA